LKEALEFAYVKRDALATYADALYQEVQEKFDRKSMRQLQLEKYQRIVSGQE
jgi:hypothetical protein